MIFFAITRAFSSNLRKITANDGENRQLQSAGISEPTVQAYFLWRYSLALVVVLATVLSAGLATYRSFEDEETQADPLQEQIDHLLGKAKSKLPMATGLLKVAEGQIAVAAEGMDDEDNDEAEMAADQTDGHAPDESEADDPPTPFAQFEQWVELISLYILPVAALAVLCFWTNLRLTFRILVAVWFASFFVPMIFAFCPWEWYETASTGPEPEAFGMESLRLISRDAKEGVGYLVALLPAVLSLIPGIQKACLRVKILLPESVLPGWFLVAAAPFYSLLLLVIFVGFYQAAGDTVLLLGMLLFIAAPFLYIIRADAFTRPLLTETDYQRMRGVQRIIGIVTMLAGVLLLYFILTQDLFGVRIIGFDAHTSLLTPLDLIEFGVEIIGRSMFMMLLGADLFMRMNLAAWKNQRDLAASPAAARYDNAMGALEQVA